MNPIKFLILLFIITAQAAYAQHYSHMKKNTQSQAMKKAADSAWEYLSSYPKITQRHVSRDSSISIFYNQEKRFRNYRERGLSFWYNFPDDKRRYVWLQRAVDRYPQYWKDIREGATLFNDIGATKSTIPVDKDELKKWNAVYPYLRADFINNANDSLKQKLFGAELSSYLATNLNPAYRMDERISIDSMINMFSNYETIVNKVGKTLIGEAKPTRIIGPLIAFYNKYDFTLSDLRKFISHFLLSENDEIKDWATNSIKVFELQTEPFSFVHSTIDGDTVDLSMKRGKVILLDFWNIYCSSCIARMNDIKPIYEKYKDKGFEVISISTDIQELIPNVREIKKKVGASWPTVVIGGKTKKDAPNGLGRRIFNKYGFVFVPQLILLDKDGLMVEYNGILQNGDFEPIIKKLLAKKY